MCGTNIPYDTEAIEGSLAWAHWHPASKQLAAAHVSGRSEQELLTKKVNNVYISWTQCHVGCSFTERCMQTYHQAVRIQLCDRQICHSSCALATLQNVTQGMAFLHVNKC